MKTFSHTFRQSLRVLLAVAFIAACPTHVVADETNASSPRDFTLALGSPQREAAERALSTLVDRAIDSRDRHSPNRIFSVDSTDALRDATIGYGFEVYLIDAASLLLSNTIDKSLRRTGVWRFVVLADGRPIGLMTVARVHGQWRTVEVGAAGLAEDISNAVTGYVRDPSAPQLRFVRSKQGLADFIQVIARSTDASRPEPTYIPLLSAQELASPARWNSDGSISAAASAASKREALSERRIIDALLASIKRGMTDPRFGFSQRGITP